jgi:hypothetical protein
MLTLLNLQVFDTIFETRAEHKLSSMSKSLYINCLFGYFKGKEVNEKNSIAFEIFINDIKNYSKWQKNFQELHKAKLIKIENDRINFINHWGQFIERAKLSTEKLFVKTDVNSFYEQLINNKSLMDLICMKHKISYQKAIELVELFIQEQNAVLNKYYNESECSKHFINWTNTYISKNKPTSEKVISKGKILGNN